MTIHSPKYPPAEIYKAFKAVWDARAMNPAVADAAAWDVAINILDAAILEAQAREANERAQTAIDQENHE